MGVQILLTINSGSSSCKATLFDISTQPGTPTRIADATYNFTADMNVIQTLTWHDQSQPNQSNVTIPQSRLSDGLFEWLQNLPTDLEITAVGHRIVHGGGRFTSAVIITDDVNDQLEQISDFDRLHAIPANKLVAEARRRYSAAAHVACFDTSYYDDMPERSRLIALPKRIRDAGVRRFGFHGLSYTYVSEEFERLAGHDARNGRVIYAHLGSGSSLTATNGGRVIDTTMGFSPASGIPSSTRSGDIDPTIAAFVQSKTGITPDEFATLAQTESGLKAISGSTGDMKHLLDVESVDDNARLAVDFYVHNVQKAIGGLAAALGGLDSLVFTGGIGEQSSIIRQRVCSSLSHLGIMLDDSRNANHEFTISSDGSQTGVHMIETDEARTIANQAIQLVANKGGMS